MTTGIIDYHYLRLVDIESTIFELLLVHTPMLKCDVKGHCEAIYGNLYISSHVWLYKKKLHRNSHFTARLKKSSIWSDFRESPSCSFSYMHFSDIASDTTYCSTKKEHQSLYFGGISLFYLCRDGLYIGQIETLKSKNLLQIIRCCG